MSLTFVLGRSQTGKSTYIYNRIIEESINNPERNYLIIVPEQFTMAIQKEIVRLHPNNCVMNIDILSFNRLAYRVYDELGMQVKEALADTGKNMIIRKIVEENKDNLGVYGRNYNKQGFISEIKSFISEMYQYGITTKYLEEFIANNKDEVRIVKKLKEILIILKEFELFLGEKYITAEGMSDMLANVIDKSDIVKKSVVCLDGFTGFTPSQIGLVTKLICLAQKTYVTLTLDASMKGMGNETSLFHLTYKTKQSLIKIAMDKNVEVTKDIVIEHDKENDFISNNNSIHSNELRWLEGNLFRYPRQVYEKETENIVVASMSNFIDEMGYVADEIEKLVSSGYRYKDIAVVCGDMDNMCDFAASEFARRKIPVFIDYKKKVGDNPYIELLYSILDIVKNSYSYDAMFRFIRCKFSDISKSDADILENYALGAGINSKTKWSRVWSSQFRVNYEDRMEKINTIREEVWEKTKNLRKQFKDRACARDYVDSLRKIAREYDCERKLASLADDFEKKQEYSYEKEYEKVFDEVEKVFSQIEELIGDTEVDLDEFIKIFESGIEEIKIGVIPQTTDHIVLGDIERSRINRVKVLFMVGTNEGIIPKESGNTNVMSDIEREKMLELGFELSPTRRQNAFIGNFYLYNNMTKPTDKLYISYSRMSEDARQILPSFIVKQITKIFPNVKYVHKREQLRGLGYDFLLENLSKRDNKPLDERWKEVFKFNLNKNDNEYNFRIDKMIDAAFDDKTDSALTKKTAQILYNNKDYSVTRVENYAKCAYAHFLKYGLNLKKRDEYEIMFPDIGIIFHDIMENFAMQLREKKLAWKELSKEDCDSIMHECVMSVTKNFENGILYESNRNEFIVRQISRIAKRTGRTLCKHIAKGQFEPAGFEVKFVKNIGNDKKNRLIGSIDRIDTASSENDENNKLVKVIDYKSSSKQFETALFRQGISMQLIVYMDAAINHKFNNMAEKNRKSGKLIPAGAFYYKFDDPIVDYSNNMITFEEETDETDNDSDTKIKFVDENISDAIEKNLKMSGIINQSDEIFKMMDESILIDEKNKFSSDTVNVKTDGSSSKNAGVGIVTTKEFELLMDYSSKMIDKINDEINSGIVERNPYKYGKENSCEYCEFASICRLGNESDTSFRNIKQENFNDFVKELLDTDGVDNPAKESN